MLRDQLTSEVAGIILCYVRERKGRLTEMSNECRINRREFNVHGLAMMKLHRLLRIIYDLCMILPPSEFKGMVDKIRETIIEYSENYDYRLLDE